MREVGRFFSSPGSHISLYPRLGAAIYLSEAFPSLNTFPCRNTRVHWFIQWILKHRISYPIVWQSQSWKRQETNYLRSSAYHLGKENQKEDLKGRSYGKPAWFSNGKKPPSLPTAGNESSFPFSRSQPSRWKANYRCRARGGWPYSINSRSPNEAARQMPGLFGGYRCPSDPGGEAAPGWVHYEPIRGARSGLSSSQQTKQQTEGLTLLDKRTSIKQERLGSFFPCNIICWLLGASLHLTGGLSLWQMRAGAACTAATFISSSGVEKELFSPPLCHPRMKKEKNK